MDLQDLAHRICTTWPNKYLKSPTVFVAELERLPPAVHHLINTLVSDLPSERVPKLGYELQWYLLFAAPRYWIRAFLIILAQTSFGILNDPLAPNQVSLGSIKEKIVHNVPLSTMSSCSPLSAHLKFIPDSGSGPVSFEPSRLIDTAQLSSMTLKDLPGQRFAFLGAGGGSDGVQAAVLALLCRNHGKEVAFVASIRAAKTTSEDQSGRMGMSRSIENHGGEVAPGVFRVTPDSTGSGRFVENVPANDLDMFLITEDPEIGGLATQVKSLLDHTNNHHGRQVDTIVITDTGGDVLVDLEQDIPANKQHQDFRVLHGLAATPNTLRSAFPDLDVQSAIVAPGIDSPLDAHYKLLAAEAKFYFPDREARKLIIDTYKKWDFTGSEKGLKAGRYGKTPFAWQEAINAINEMEDMRPASATESLKDLGQAREVGQQSETSGEAQSVLDMNRLVTVAIPLPMDRVMSKTNPWNPFVPLQYAMASVLFMDAENLLRSISSSRRVL